jgi:hypothetical protein
MRLDEARELRASSAVNERGPGDRPGTLLGGPRRQPGSGTTIQGGPGESWGLPLLVDSSTQRR